VERPVVQTPRRDRSGPLFETAEHRWPDVGGILSRQPWDELGKAIESKSGARDFERQRRFVELLVQWNRTVSNLISQNDENRIVGAHLAPSLEPAAWMKSHEFSKWLDFGSGGGFPAIPLAIYGVGESWDLVESRRTKTLFLRRAVEHLELTGMRIFVARLEDLLADFIAGRDSVESADDAGTDSAEAAEPVARPTAPPTLRPPYDGFTSRATLALGPTLLLARPLVRAGGAAFLWKGSRLEEEIASAGEALQGWAETERRALVNEKTTVIKYTRDSE
jgi:16S rRNA G527 N7-methylase RsmG